MAVYEFVCTGCHKKFERRLSSFCEVELQWCRDCGSFLQLTPSVPAKTRVGKYGKGGGLKDGDR